jgi:hypothetical protein
MMTCEFVDRTEMDYMGYSVRTEEWRYSEWVKWNGTDMRPEWDAGVGAELYDHRAGTDIWNSENENMAAQPQHAQVVAELSALLRAHFGKAPGP